MTEMAVILTDTDKVILESYKHICDGLSDYMGEGYEIVLHSLENFDHSVIKIINGYHTGRTEGAPITDLALAMLAEIKNNPSRNYITYLCHNKKGEPLKSSTMTIRGENGRIIGLLCINFYLNTPYIQILNNFFPSQNGMGQRQENESFSDNVQDLIISAIAEVRGKVESDPTIPAASKKKEIISQLMERGIFNLKDSVIKSAEILGISKNTVYMHIRNLK